MNLETSIRVATDWWTEKVSANLDDRVDTEDLRRIFEKNIRQHICDNFHTLNYGQLTIGASGYGGYLDEIVTESVAEIGIEDFVLPRRASLVITRWYSQVDQHSVCAYENNSDDPDYKKTLLDVD